MHANAHPDSVDRTLEAIELHLCEDPGGARRRYAWALESDPQSPELLYALAVAALEDDDLSDAQERLAALSEAAPAHEGGKWLRTWVAPGRSRSSRAIPVLLLLRSDAAAACCARVLDADPDNATAHFLQGFAYSQGEQHRKAIASFDKAIALKPSFVEAIANKGLALSLLVYAERVNEDFWRDAVHCFDRALELNPGIAMAYRTRSLMLSDLGEMGVAIRDGERACAMEPANVEWRIGLGMRLLRSGDWPRGWDEYEHRPGGLKDTMTKPEFRGKPWMGEPLAGKSIVVHAEQGLGDIINFFRFVRPMQQIEGANVHVWLPPSMQPLLMPTAFTKRSQIPRVDYRCSFMSLACVLGVRPDTVPDAGGYVQADRAKVAQWSARLGPPRGLRVGLAWSGNAKHTSDVHRSLALADLLPLFHSGLAVEFVCLQKDLRKADKALLDAVPMSFHGEDIADFTDTAALCELMDLVIAVDTSIAHLAGAMAKPVWILVSANSEWRWLMDREDTPWYSSARLMRQEKLLDWRPLIARVTSELESLCAQSGARARHPPSLLSPAACAFAAACDGSPGAGPFPSAAQPPAIAAR